MCVDVKNVIYNTNPVFLHAPGKELFNPFWNKILANKCDNKICNINLRNVDIITWISNNLSYSEEQSHKIPYIFPQSLHKYGIKCKILRNNLWLTNRVKIKLSLEFIDAATTKYILGGDSSDVIFVGREFDIEQILSEYNCKLLFNAEKKFWPEEFVSMAERQFARTSPPFSYLNAGLWVGEREFCKQFFEDALKYKSLPVYPKSEQVCIHLSYMKLYPEVQLDYKCKLFQNTNRVNDEVII